MTMNGKQFMVKLTEKIGQADLIGRETAVKVAGAIKMLKSDLSRCKEDLITAKDNCTKTQLTADASARTAEAEVAAAAARIKQIEGVAQVKEEKLNETVGKLGLSKTTQFELERRIKELERANGQIQDQLRSDLEAAKARESALHMAKEANEAAMSDVFNNALNAINKALTTINVDELLQSGGFQSSSSGVTDFKKYRTSSRSYNIKELRKKKKESRKKEKERKKGSRKKERRSKKRRKD